VSEQRVFIKYPNRKLYDVANSCYVSASAILELIRSGSDVKVVDKAKMVDVTGAVLIKAIVDENISQFYTNESVNLLKKIIREGGFAEYSKKFK
jgi:polyhydroxyalkanoate synthesis repressor PhaR